MIYSGSDKYERGVGDVLNSETKKSVKRLWAFSDPIILDKLSGEPFY